MRSPEASAEEKQDSPQLAHLRFRLKQEEEKTAVLDAHPETKDHDIDGAKTRNDLLLKQIRDEIKRLEKK